MEGRFVWAQSWWLEAAVRWVHFWLRDCGKAPRRKRKVGRYAGKIPIFLVLLFLSEAFVSELSLGEQQEAWHPSADAFL